MGAAPLLLLLGTCLGALRLLHRASASSPSQNRAQSWVHAMQGGAVLLQIKINISSPGNTVNKIEWTFQGKSSSRSLTVAEFQGGKILRPNPRDRFGERLEAINGTTLRIKDLALEDGGVYEAVARLSTAENEHYAFNLTVHKPVPELQIRPQRASYTPAACNVTLQCRTLGPGEFSVSWRGGNPLRSLEGSADWYQLSGNRTDLHLSWEPNPLDSEFTCQVSNAVGQRKEVSFDLRSVCSEEEGRNRTQLGCLLSLLCVTVLISAGAFGTWQWMKRRKTLSHSVLSEAIPAEPQYAEIIKRNPPKGNEDQDPDLDQKSSTSTVYAQLNRPLQSPEQVT